MSNFTDFAENKIIDAFRTQALSLPSGWKIAPFSAASDSSYTEVTGTGIARATVTRNLANWAGTQGPGTTLASSGTSKTTSNNNDIGLGTPAGSSGTITHVGLLDASDNGWAYAPLPSPIVTAAAVPITIAAGSLAFTLGVGGGATDYLVNALIDLLLRGQAWTFPATFYLGAHVAGGSEVGGGVGYARYAFAPSLTSLSGTQAAGSTSASSGTGGRSSNNAGFSFANPTADQGDIDRVSINDAATLGNQLWIKALAAVKSLGVGRALTFQPDTFGITVS